MNWVFFLHCVGLKPRSGSCGRPTGTGRRPSSCRSSSCGEIRLRCCCFVALFVCDLMKTRSRQLAVMLAHSGVPLFKSESAELAANQSSKPNGHAVIYGASAQLCWSQAGLRTDPDGRSAVRKACRKQKQAAAKQQ